ncbi:response regulator [Bdellovibrio sp. HCB337]|uniref:response regulator n=1 Tax=Bdellovibrio sp. HCB337 TaxID=3394358 RepID=UPI0039A70EF9
MAHILIVDDQQSVLLTLEALLRSENHLVTACTNAIDAMAKLNGEPFDLVISDVVMSVGGTGLALVRTIRGQPHLARIPVILLTGKREKTDVEKGIQAGADDYVVKPIDPTLLLAKIRTILTKEDKTPRFAEAPVNMKAEFETKTEIVSISEIGCTIKSNVYAAPGALIKIHSEVFKEIGISNPTLRIVSQEEGESQDGMHKLLGNFVGLSERELTPLRLWIRSKKRF